MPQEDKTHSTWHLSGEEGTRKVGSGQQSKGINSAPPEAALGPPGLDTSYLLLLLSPGLKGATCSPRESSKPASLTGFSAARAPKEKFL